MTEFVFNGVSMNEEEFQQALEESQEFMVAQEKEIREKYGVSENTASAILYLRSRSRWTLEKENELITRDKAGDPIPLGKVLAGEF